MRDRVEIIMEAQNSSAPMGMSRPVPEIDLRHQLTSADLIITATVTKVSDGNSPVSLVSAQADAASDRLRQAEVSIFKTLSGAPAHSRATVFFLESTLPSRPWAELTQGQTVLLFLRSMDQGYVPVEPTENPIQTLPDITPPPDGASRAEAVMHELEQIILTANPKSNASLITQAGIARASLRGDVNLRLLDATVLQDPVRRTAWIALALSEGKVEVLGEVAPLFTVSVTDKTQALRSLLLEKVSEIRAPAARPQLAALLDSPSVELARAAAVALRQLHDPATVPNLIQALDNGDQEVRYQAVMGLAELEPSADEGPSYDLYRSDEPRYLRFWKQWWVSSGRSRAP